MRKPIITNRKQPATPNDDGHAELLKYVKDRYDKSIAARESLIARLGNIRLLASVLLSAIALMFPVTSKAFEQANELVGRIVAVIPLVPMSLAIYWTVRALLSVPKLVGQIDVGLAGADSSRIKEAMSRSEIDLKHVLTQLTSNYLAAIEKNTEYNKNAGADLESASVYIRRGLHSAVTFVIFSIIVSLVVQWSPRHIGTRPTLVAIVPSTSPLCVSIVSPVGSVRTKQRGKAITSTAVNTLKHAKGGCNSYLWHPDLKSGHIGLQYRVQKSDPIHTAANTTQT